MTFLRISGAARTVESRAQAGVYRYPQADDWSTLQGEPHLLGALQTFLRTNSRGSLAIVGPHGCGKTFNLIYLGLWWEALSPPKTLAFYSPNTSDLSPEHVAREWAEIGEYRRCLWIVDDIQSDGEGRVPEMLENFEDLALTGHYLITAGWSSEGQVDEVARIALSENSIRLALEAMGQADLAQDEGLVEHLAQSRVGLRQILWATRFRPDLLNKTAKLEASWASHVTRGVSVEGARILGILSRLKFLGVGFIPSGSEEATELSNLYQGTGLLYWSDENELEIADDRIAQLVMQDELPPTRSSAEVGHGFVEPLRGYLSSLLSQGLLEKSGNLLGSLRRRSRHNLLIWLGRKGPDSTSLDQDLLDENLLEQIRDLAIGNPDFTSAARLVVIAAHSQRTWGTSAARDVLASLRPEEVKLIETKIQRWLFAVELAAIAADPRSASIACRAALSGGILDAFTQTSASERGRVLRASRQLGEAAYSAFLERFCKVLSAQVTELPPRRAWRRLKTLGKREPEAAVRLLGGLQRSAMERLVLSAPAATQSFRKTVRRKLQDRGREQLAALLEGAVAGRTVCNRDVDEWTGPRDLHSIVELARSHPATIDVEPVITKARELVRNAGAAALTNLSHVTSRYIRRTRLRAEIARSLAETIRDGREPLAERIESLERIEPWLISDELASTLGLRWVDLDPADCFRVLWALSAAESVDSNTRGDLTRKLLDRSPDAFTHTLRGLAMAGLCMFLLGDEAQLKLLSRGFALDKLAAPSAETTLPESPQWTAGQFLALARLVRTDSDRGYPNLVWLAEALARPSSAYRKAWQRVKPPALRRMILEMILAAAKVLAQGELSSLSEQLALSLLSTEQDQIWGNHAPARLALVNLAAGSSAARELLVRRSTAWADLLRSGKLSVRSGAGPGPTSTLGFLQKIAELSHGGDSAASAAGARVFSSLPARIPPEVAPEIARLRAAIPSKIADQSGRQRGTSKGWPGKHGSGSSDIET